MAKCIINFNYSCPSKRSSSLCTIANSEMGGKGIRRRRRNESKPGRLSINLRDPSEFARMARPGISWFNSLVMRGYKSESLLASFSSSSTLHHSWALLDSENINWVLPRPSGRERAGIYHSRLDSCSAMFLLSLDYCNVCTLSLSPWPLHESTCLISLSNARDTRNSKQASLVSICHLASHQTQAG